ncbi:hypothetical protein LTS18_011583, partial [Coniosporium uncinatum]
TSLSRQLPLLKISNILVCCSRLLVASVLSRPSWAGTSLSSCLARPLAFLSRFLHSILAASFSPTPRLRLWRGAPPRLF